MSVLSTDHDALGLDNFHNVMTGGFYNSGGDVEIYVINDYPLFDRSEVNGASHPCYHLYNNPNTVNVTTCGHWGAGTADCELFYSNDLDDSGYFHTGAPH